MNARRRERQRAARICHLIEQANAAERDLAPLLWLRLVRDLARVPHAWSAFGDLAVSYEFYEELLDYYAGSRPNGWCSYGFLGLEVYGKRIIPVVALTPAE